jgi:hypothetical protein
MKIVLIPLKNKGKLCLKKNKQLIYEFKNNSMYTQEKCNSCL